MAPPKESPYPLTLPVPFKKTVFVALRLPELSIAQSIRVIFLSVTSLDVVNPTPP